AAAPLRAAPAPPKPKPRRLQRAAEKTPVRRAGAAPAIRPVGGAPMLAIVIDDLGFDPRRTERLAAMPGPMSFAFLPNAGPVAGQARMAEAAGHAVMLHMPMEPQGRENPGAQALWLGDDAAAIRKKLMTALDAVPGAVGMNNHMGSLLTASAAHMGVVADVLRARGLIFLDSRTGPRAIAAEVAAARGGAWAARDVFLDDDARRSAIDRQLRAAERLAHRRGYAVAIGHPYDDTIAALRAFLPAARRRGIKLVSIEAIAALNARDPQLIAEARTSTR
ncbi:MAG: divergent polysaccharide deacetylase family protein, partial [Pseudomonadota bacterium]